MKVYLNIVIRILISHCYTLLLIQLLTDSKKFAQALKYLKWIHAFRQLRVDHKDIDLLGIKCPSYVLDASILFGFKNWIRIFLKMNGLRYIMINQEYPGLINYIDDLIHCNLPSKMDSAYKFFIQFLHHLGLPIRDQKLIP